MEGRRKSRRHHFDTEFVIMLGTCGSLTCYEVDGNNGEFDDDGSQFCTVNSVREVFDVGPFTPGSSVFILLRGHSGGVGDYDLTISEGSCDGGTKGCKAAKSPKVQKSCPPKGLKAPKAAKAPKVTKTPKNLRFQ